MSLPLHLCIGRDTNEEVLQLLLDAFPEGATHTAEVIKSIASANLVMLLTRLPKTLLHPSCCVDPERRLATLCVSKPFGQNDELPLHKAVASAKPSVVKTLLKAFPRGELFFSPCLQ